ncbi:hypothetical protein [Capnocytophaga leadbetteri]
MFYTLFAPEYASYFVRFGIF